MVTNSIPGLVSFYWISQSGVPIYRWYQNAAVGELNENKDTLLGGFLTANMNFSREMFDGENIAHMDLLNHSLFFSTLACQDILVLVTSNDFDEKTAHLLLNHIRGELDTRSNLKAYECTDYSDWMDKIVLNAIDHAIPKDLFAKTKSTLEAFESNPHFAGFLISDIKLPAPVKKIKDVQDFELLSFLDSVFWDQQVRMHQEITSLGERFLGIGKIQWNTIHLSIGNLLNFYFENGFISLAYDNAISEPDMTRDANEVLKHSN